MTELVAIAYEDEDVADRAVEELERCGEELLVDADASAVLVCERDGTCRLTISRQAGAAGHWSEFWGSLLEALLGDDHAPGPIEPEFRRRLVRLLRPGTSILLLAVPDGGRGRALEALGHFDGRALGQRLA
jgi:uncharacterized membrane protein